MKRIVKILCIGLVSGLILLGFQRGFGIDAHVFAHYYWRMAPLIVVAAVGINLAYNHHHHRKLKALLKDLEQGNAVAFVSHVEGAIPGLKSKYLRNLYTLNLSAGYCDLGEYTVAKQLLQDLSLPKGLLRDVQAVNLCYTYFRLGETPLAMDVYHANAPAFSRLRPTPGYGGSIGILDILVLLEEGKTQQAATLLAELKGKYQDFRLQADYHWMEERCV